MSERRLAAILAADVAGYSRLAGADEERTLARLRALRGDLLDPAVAAHHGRVVKRAGDGSIVEFRSVIDAVRCAIEIQNGMVERNHGLAPERQILFRIGIHIGDVVGEADGDLMGDGVNIAARLEGIAEPGGICLSHAAYEQVRDKMTATFTDLGDKKLKNIARPMHVYRVELDRKLASAQKEAKGAPRLSIVVLPFANIGGDPEQEYFVDGVTESLTTDLSRMANSLVIGRNTAFTYKGKPVDLKQIGRELNVRYVLEGSVQRGGNRLRVNVQLIDAETGNHLWAERFDKPLADLFDMQDEIVARLANQLNAELIAAEARRAEISPRPDSMDLYFQGMAVLNQGASPQNLASAESFFEHAVAVDPGNVAALVGLATVDFATAGVYATDDTVARFAASEARLTKVLSVAPNHALAHHLLGGVYNFTNRATQAIAECERALALDRNLAGAHARIGFAKISVGRAEEAEAHIQEAFRISPRDARANAWMTMAGEAKLHLGADEASLACFARAIEINRNLTVTHFYRAAALAQLGRLGEARTAAQEGLTLDPTFNIGRFRKAAPSDHPTYLAQRERLYEGMRLAGVPEG